MVGYLGKYEGGIGMEAEWSAIRFDRISPIA
jgi:hypothetical protein